MAQGFKIAFFGSSLVSAYWNGAATYYRGIIKALHQRGHSITFYEPDAYGRQQHRDMVDPDWARVVVYSSDGTNSVMRALEQAGSADIVVKASGVGVFDELLEEAVIGMKKPYQISIFWDVDAPATLERLGKTPGDPFIRHIPEYDMIFTYGGGDPVRRAYIGFGAATCTPVYNALDPTTHFPVTCDRGYRCTLSFLGNRLPDREHRVDRFFLAAASRLPDKGFLLGGAGWDDKPLPQNVRYLGHVFTHQHNTINCSSQSVLNVSRESMARFGYSPATRVFEAAGAGACIITDNWEGIELFLEPGKEILVAESGDDVADQISGLQLQDSRKVGQAARRRILAEHTYAHRAKQVESVLNA